MKDLAFSSGIPRSFYNHNINEIRFPRHLNITNLHPDSKSVMNFANIFHQFIASMVTNRPIHSYGNYINMAQRIVWNYSYVDRPPINVMYLCNNHYISLLPLSENVTSLEKYKYYCYFLLDAVNTAFQNRCVRPENEIYANILSFRLYSKQSYQLRS